MIVWVEICSKWFLVSGTVWLCGNQSCPRVSKGSLPWAPFRKGRQGRDSASLCSFSLCTPPSPSLSVSDAHFLQYWSQTVLGSATQQSDHISEPLCSLSCGMLCCLHRAVFYTSDDTRKVWCRIVAIIWAQQSFCPWGLTFTMESLSLDLTPDHGSQPWGSLALMNHVLWVWSWGLIFTMESLSLDLTCWFLTVGANCEGVWLSWTRSSGSEILQPCYPHLRRPDLYLQDLCLVLTSLLERYCSYWPAEMSPSSKLKQSHYISAHQRLLLSALDPRTEAPIHTPKHCDQSMSSTSKLAPSLSTCHVAADREVSSTRTLCCVKKAVWLNELLR